MFGVVLKCTCMVAVCVSCSLCSDGTLMTELSSLCLLLKWLKYQLIKLVFCGVVVELTYEVSMRPSIPDS